MNIPLYVGIYCSFSSNMSQNIWFVIIWALAGIVIGRLVAKLYFLQQRSSDRKQAVKQSKSTTLGYVSEKIAPLLPDFPYSYKDLVFLWKGVDYLCFDGLSEGEMKQVVFLEIKTGKSQLNKNESLIKNCIEKGRVKWETVRI
jgi:predicted Holliday junction resolvase-like endonuclease